MRRSQAHRKPTGWHEWNNLSHGDYDRASTHADGKTAAQYYNVDDLRVLTKFLDWRMSKWPWHKCVSMGLTIYLHHAGYPGLTLPRDGTLRLGKMCSLREFQIMNTTPEGLLRNVETDQVGPATKKRFEFLNRDAEDLNDVLIRVGQGHNRRAQAMLDLDELHERMVSSHPKLQKWVMHGTQRESAQNIRRQGLYPGVRRADIHCVAILDDGGDQAGLREGTNTIAPINSEALIALGGAWRYSRQGVWLTEGVNDRHGWTHIPPSCIGISIDRVTGEPVFTDDMQEAPATDEQGMLDDGKYELEQELRVSPEAATSLFGQH